MRQGICLKSSSEYNYQQIFLEWGILVMDIFEWLVPLLMSVFVVGSFTEMFFGWKVYIPVIYHLRPTVYRTEKTYMADPEKILNVDFNNMEEILVKTVKGKKIIFFRRKYYWFRFEMQSSWPLWGVIKLTDLGGKTKAAIVGKPPLFTSWFLLIWIALFLVGFIGVGLSAIKGKSELFIIVLIVPVFICAICGLSYVLEKGRFLRHLKDIDDVLSRNGINPIP